MSISETAYCLSDPCSATKVTGTFDRFRKTHTPRPLPALTPFQDALIFPFSYEEAKVQRSGSSCRKVNPGIFARGPNVPLLSGDL